MIFSLSSFFFYLPALPSAFHCLFLSVPPCTLSIHLLSPCLFLLFFPVLLWLPPILTGEEWKSSQAEEEDGGRGRDFINQFPPLTDSQLPEFSSGKAKQSKARQGKASQARETWKWYARYLILSTTIFVFLNYAYGIMGLANIRTKCWQQKYHLELQRRERQQALSRGLSATACLLTYLNLPEKTMWSLLQRGEHDLNLSTFHNTFTSRSIV